MKPLFLAISLAFLTAGSALAQGELIFENYFGSGNPANAPAYYWPGFTPLSGPAYMADLLYGTSAGTVNQDAGFATVFSSGVGAGYFLGGPQTIADSGIVYMRIVVWQAAAGATWASSHGGGGLYDIIGPVFSEVVPVSPSPPATFAGLISAMWTEIPEPSPAALGVLGLAILFLFRRRKSAAVAVPLFDQRPTAAFQTFKSPKP